MSTMKRSNPPSDILSMNAEAYEEVGETLQQHCCFRILSLAMSCVRAESTETAITATIDGYNDWKAEAAEAEAQADAMYSAGVSDYDPSDGGEGRTATTRTLSREEKEREIGCWKYLRGCTITRNTIHWSTEKPYRVLDALDFRMLRTAEAASEAYLKTQAAEVERRTGGKVTADHWFAVKLKEGTRDLLGLDKIGRPALQFANSIDEVEDMPIDWSEQWELIVRKAAKRMAARPGSSIDDLVNSLAIVEGAGVDTVA